MSARAMRVLLLLLTTLAATTAYCKTTAIDDSGTLPYDAPLTLHWQQPPTRGAVNTTVVGTATIRVRLNLGPWVRRTGRIYLVLPAQQPGPLTASWTTQGRLLAGRLVSGSRTLVYSGPITAPFLEDVLQLTLAVDARQLRQLYRVNFQFQIDEG